MRTARLQLPGIAADARAWRHAAIVTGGSAMLSAGLAWMPFITVGTAAGILLTTFALTQPLALVGLMLVIGPADLSFVTGGFKAMLEQLGGLDMNGIRLIGMSAALTLVVLADRDVWRQAFRPASLFYVLLVLWGAATLIWSPAQLDGLRLLLKIAYPLLVFLVIAGLSPDRRQLDRLMDAVLIGAAVLCLVVNPLYVAFGDFEREIGGYLRLRGLGIHQNPFSFYLIAAATISFVRFTTRRQLRYLLLCAICGGWMVLTITRIAFGAALAALFAVGVVSAISARQTRVLIASIIAAAALAIPFAPPVLERTLGFVPSPGELLALFTSPEALLLSMNWEGRLVFWAVLVQAFMTSPIVGLGMGASTYVLRLHFPMFAVPVAHNEYLRLVMETGLLGSMLYTLAVIAWASIAVRAARVPDRTVREYALPAVGVLAALAVICTTDNAFDYYGQFTQYAGFLCGGAAAAVVCWKRHEEAGAEEHVQPAWSR